MATKVLVLGLPASGKTTLLKTLKDAYVVAVDGKEYPFEQPHTNIESFENVSELLDVINEKVLIYEQKFGKQPNTIVFDSVSRILTYITDACNAKFNGFTVWSEANKQISVFVNFINDIVASGINVVLVSHVIWNEEISRFTEVAQGNFGKIGGFASVVDFSVSLEVKSNKRIAHHRNPKFLARTLVESVPDSQPVEEFDLQNYLNLINQQKTKAKAWSI